MAINKQTEEEVNKEVEGKAIRINTVVPTKKAYGSFVFEKAHRCTRHLLRLVSCGNDTQHLMRRLTGYYQAMSSEIVRASRHVTKNYFIVSTGRCEVKAHELAFFTVPRSR